MEDQEFDFREDLQEGDAEAGWLEDAKEEDHKMDDFASIDYSASSQPRASNSNSNGDGTNSSNTAWTSGTGSGTSGTGSGTSGSGESGTSGTSGTDGGASSSDPSGGQSSESATTENSGEPNTNSGGSSNSGPSNSSCESSGTSNSKTESNGTSNSEDNSGSTEGSKGSSDESVQERSQASSDPASGSGSGSSQPESSSGSSGNSRSSGSSSESASVESIDPGKRKRKESSERTSRSSSDPDDDMDSPPSEEEEPLSPVTEKDEEDEEMNELEGLRDSQGSEFQIEKVIQKYNETKEMKKAMIPNERRYICYICGQTYRQNSGLYCHMKSRHPEDYTMDRKGRPMKILEKRFEPVSKVTVIQHEIMEKTTANQAQDLMSKIEDELYMFQQMKSIGGPTNPLVWFCDVQPIDFDLRKAIEEGEKRMEERDSTTFDARQTLSQLNEYLESLYPSLRQVQDEVQGVLGKYEASVHSVRQLGQGSEFFLQLQAEERKALTIDQVISLYLVDIAHKLKATFYKAVACLFQLFRSFVNQEGFEKLSGMVAITTENPWDRKLQVSDLDEFIDLSEKSSTRAHITANVVTIKSPRKAMLHLLRKMEEYRRKQISSSKKSSEIPLFINSFVGIYLQRVCPMFDYDLAVAIFENFCRWLENRGLLGDYRVYSS